MPLNAHSLPDQFDIAVDAELNGMDGLRTDMDMHALLHNM